MASVNFRQNSKKTKRAPLLILGVLCLLFAAAVLLIMKYLADSAAQNRAESAAIPFDTKACIRLRDFSRIYAIASDPRRANLIWFCGAEGIRVLDIATLEWQRYGLDHGLLSEEVTGISWYHEKLFVGTGAGIAEFDTASRSFRPPGNDHRALNTRVLTMTSVPDFGVLFSIEGNGLYAISDTGKIRQVSAPGVDSTHDVTSLKTLADGTVFLGLAGSVMLHFDPVKGSFDTCNFERPVSVTTLVWDFIELPDAVYIGTSNDGIWTAPTLGDTLRQLESNPAKGAYAFAPDSDGFWCGTPFGLWRYYRRSDAWVQLVNPEEKEPTDFQVYALLNTPQRIWYGTRDLGAGYFDKIQDGWQRMRAGLSKPNVTALAASGSDVWTSYGYQGNGVDRFTANDLGFVRNYGRQAGIGDATIQSLTVVGGRLYFGGFEGFGWFEPAAGVTRYFDTDSGLPAKDIAAIVSDRPGHLLLASIFGILEFDSSTNRFAAIEPTGLQRITAILPIGDSLWYGTLGQGFYVYDRIAKAATRCGLENAMRVMSVDSAHLGDTAVFIVSTREQGIFSVSRTDRSVRQLPVPSSLLKGAPEESSNNILAGKRIENRIWFATREAGCLIFDLESRRWAGFAPADGLVSSQVRSFAESEKYIWIGCYGGMNRIDKSYIDTVLTQKFGR